MTEPILRLADVQFHYGTSDWCLDIPALAFGPGTLVGILGPNGSGKSTLLRISAGVLPIDAGSVTAQGQELRTTERRAIARMIGYLPQSVNSDFDYTAAEIVRMGRYAHVTGFGVLHPDDEEAIVRSSRVTEVEPLLTRRLSELSGGERKRVLLASVLAQEPRLLLLDEPASALDVHHQIRLFQLLRELTADGLGVVVVTHDINLASVYCDELVLLVAGKIQVSGPPDRILTRENLMPICGRDVIIQAHPQSGTPVILPPHIAPDDEGDGA